MTACSTGVYGVVVASPPCSTFSVSRHFRSASSPDGGPPVLRTRSEPSGASDVPDSHRPELDRANELIRRTCQLLSATHTSGGNYVLEHPADRGDMSTSYYLHGQHAPLWLYPDVASMAAAH
eukprot:4682814-Pleurochrysis_carterae.AAC.1